MAGSSFCLNLARFLQNLQVMSFSPRLKPLFTLVALAGLCSYSLVGCDNAKKVGDQVTKSGADSPAEGDLGAGDDSDLGDADSQGLNTTWGNPGGIFNPNPTPPEDVPVCGDSACNGDETCSSCASDCGVCPIDPGPDCGPALLTVSEDEAALFNDPEHYPIDTTAFGGLQLSICRAKAQSVKIYGTIPYQRLSAHNPEDIGQEFLDRMGWNNAVYLPQSVPYEGDVGGIDTIWLGLIRPEISERVDGETDPVPYPSEWTLDADHFGVCDPEATAGQPDFCANYEAEFGDDTDFADQAVFWLKVPVDGEAGDLIQFQFKFTRPSGDPHKFVAVVDYEGDESADLGYPTDILSEEVEPPAPAVTDCDVAPMRDKPFFKVHMCAQNMVAAFVNAKCDNSGSYYLDTYGMTGALTVGPDGEIVGGDDAGCGDLYLPMKCQRGILHCAVHGVGWSATQGNAAQARQWVFGDATTSTDSKTGEETQKKMGQIQNDSLGFDLATADNAEGDASLADWIENQGDCAGTYKYREGDSDDAYTYDDIADHGGSGTKSCPARAVATFKQPVVISCVNPYPVYNSGTLPSLCGPIQHFTSWAGKMTLMPFKLGDEAGDCGISLNGIGQWTSGGEPSDYAFFETLCAAAGMSAVECANWAGSGFWDEQTIAAQLRSQWSPTFNFDSDRILYRCDASRCPGMSGIQTSEPANCTVCSRDTDNAKATIIDANDTVEESGGEPVSDAPQDRFLQLVVKADRKNTECNRFAWKVEQFGTPGDFWISQKNLDLRHKSELKAEVITDESGCDLARGENTTENGDGYPYPRYNHQCRLKIKYKAQNCNVNLDESTVEADAWTLTGSAADPDQGYHPISCSGDTCSVDGDYAWDYLPCWDSDPDSWCDRGGPEAQGLLGAGAVAFNVEDGGEGYLLPPATSTPPDSSADAEGGALDTALGDGLWRYRTIQIQGKPRAYRVKLTCNGVDGRHHSVTKYNPTRNNDIEESYWSQCYIYSDSHYSDTTVRIRKKILCLTPGHQVDLTACNPVPRSCPEGYHHRGVSDEYPIQGSCEAGNICVDQGDFGNVCLPGSPMTECVQDEVDHSSGASD